MRRANLIDERDSSYSALMAVVPKTDGALRVCIDLRQVNMNIVNEAYPIKRIDNNLEAMAGLIVFTTLDLKKRYHQLLLHPHLKRVTPFLTPNGIKRWKILPLGMKTAGAVFQHVMEQIMRELQQRSAAVYI